MSRGNDWGGLKSAELEQLVSKRWKIEVEAFDPHVLTCFGQKVEVSDSTGDWCERINFEHIGYGDLRLPWRRQFHHNPFVEWVYRSCVIERIQTHIDVRPIFALAPLIREIEVEPSEENIAPAVLAWATTLIARERAALRPHLVTGGKALFQWAVDALLPNFLEADLDTLDTYYTRKRRGGFVTTLDRNQGPFTSGELLSIERALLSKEDSLRERALFYLCRDWGLRPIQLALLRVEDVGQDEAGPFILVPSVKGVRRSRLRRSKKNLKKRYLTDEAANALLTYIDQNSAKVEQLRMKLAEDTGVTITDIEKLPLALFPTGRDSARNKRFYSDPGLRAYALHPDSTRISREISGWSSLLMIPRDEKAGASGQESQWLDISCYRFRRTKGTSMVMSGHSPEDVAEALDHVTVATVRDYFQFNQDLIDFVNVSHNASAEITEAVASWSGRISTQDAPVTLPVMRVANLGLCKAVKPCPHHPTVTCYSCPKFRPFKEADHETAQRAIEDLQVRIHAQGTGPVRNQVDVALVGVRSLIKALANEQK